jgi:LmbE family N-acetylglucosaminyl deacetylase
MRGANRYGIWEHASPVVLASESKKSLAAAAVEPPIPPSPHPSDVSSAWALRSGGRPLFIFAHQDDETVLAGIIARIVGDDRCGTFVWWTNGDGLAPLTGESPRAYAKIRMAEAAEAMRRLGAQPHRKRDLDSSEIENYRRLTHVAAGGQLRQAALHYFMAEAERVERAIREADPDRVFLLAWQGGHPEHDLTHLMTVRAVQKLRQETGRPIPIIQCPAYEYVILCALRFNPWFDGDRRRIELSLEERQKKRAVFDAYPSQQDLFRRFEQVVKVVAKFSALRGHPVDVESYLAVEEFGVVDPELDYTRSTHRVEALNYINDDFEGIKIRFDTMIRPVAEMLLFP